MRSNAVRDNRLRLEIKSAKGPRCVDVSFFSKKRSQNIILFEKNVPTISVFEIH